MSERINHEELRHTHRDAQFAVGTLACSRCDAPVSPGSAPLKLTEALACPFCAHQAPVREFLTLGPPTRPARVVLRVVYPAQQLARLRPRA
jgi:transcription elongation factor Elf1